MRIFAFVMLALPSLAFSTLPTSYADFLDDTLLGLARLRGSNGLPRDALLIGKTGALRPVHDLPEVTSPTNIGLGLLIQLDLLDRANYQAEAQSTIDQMLATLAQEPFHPSSGLFFSWYRTVGLEAVQRDVSSIDNLHLALGLWSVAKKLPGTATAKLAQRLFDRMDFSPFADQQKVVLGGNLHWSPNGTWVLENFRYDYLGSETRSLYSVGAAIQIRGVARSFLEGAISHLTVEIAAPYGERILRTWDGGTFQLFLPELLVGESGYSNELATAFRAYANFARKEGIRRQLPLPATHSACVIGLIPESDDPQSDTTRALYEGQEGSSAVGNRQRTQLFDDSTIAIHAVLMAATADPNAYLGQLTKAVANSASDPVPLFREKLGFVDGINGHALPVVLSLDKGMEALALLRIIASDHLTASARLLAGDKEARDELKRIYDFIDLRMAATAAGRT